MLKLKYINSEDETYELVPCAHTSTDGSKYGVASNSEFGHVKVMDVYQTNISGEGVVVSQNAIHNMYYEQSKQNTKINELQKSVTQYYQLNPLNNTSSGVTGYSLSEISFSINQEGPITCYESENIKLYNNRSFDAFEWLCFVIIEDSLVRNSITIPRKVFDQRDVELFYVNSANEQKFMTIVGKRTLKDGNTLELDPTQFKIKISSNLYNKRNNAALAIFGFGGLALDYPYSVS